MTTLCKAWVCWAACAATVCLLFNLTTCICMSGQWIRWGIQPENHVLGGGWGGKQRVQFIKLSKSSGMTLFAHAAGAFEACLRDYYAAGEAGALEASAFGSFVCLLPALAGGTAAGAVPTNAD